MIELAGLKNTKSLDSIQSLCSGEFPIDGIEEENLLLLIIADQEKLPPRMAIGRFLQLTGLDYIEVRRKNKRAARYQHCGGTVISGTEFPYSNFHRTRGTTRRTVLIQSWRADASLRGIEDEFTDEVMSGYTNFLLSLPEQWILATLESAPGEPTVALDSLDNPLVAWLMDCVNITGDSSDRVQLGRDKTKFSQLFGGYTAYCELKGIAPGYQKSHSTFAKEFEALVERFTAPFEDGAAKFGRSRPGNKLHYSGISLKIETDDSSLLALDSLAQEESIDSPCQSGLIAQLGRSVPEIAATAEPEPSLTVGEARTPVPTPKPIPQEPADAELQALSRWFLEQTPVTLPKAPFELSRGEVVQDDKFLNRLKNEVERFANSLNSKEPPSFNVRSGQLKRELLAIQRICGSQNTQSIESASLATRAG